jgi:hypothetical protein
MSSALSYPNMVILRACVMYSLFIMFLQSFFIKWWLDHTQKASHTWKAVLSAILSLIAYAFAISTLDRGDVNYLWA